MSFQLPQLRRNDRCNDLVSATITVQGFIEAFQIGAIKIDANESLTIVRLYQGTVYVAQNRTKEVWRLGSLPLREFLQALEYSGSTKIPGKMRVMLLNALDSFEVHSTAEMATCMGWNGVCP